MKLKEWEALQGKLVHMTIESVSLERETNSLEISGYLHEPSEFIDFTANFEPGSAR